MAPKSKRRRTPARKPSPAKRGKIAARKVTARRVGPAKKTRGIGKATPRPARKAQKTAARPKVKRRAPKENRGKGTAATARTVVLDAEEAELLQSLKKNPRHHRLPPDKRHEVPEDERVEREGVAGKVFVGADTQDEEAQQLGEEFVRSVTSGEEAESEMEEEAQVEEQGGPFVITTAREEYAYDSDESNPPGTEREPFPRVSLPVRPKGE